MESKEYKIIENYDVIFTNKYLSPLENEGRILVKFDTEILN